MVKKIDFENMTLLLEDLPDRADRALNQNQIGVEITPKKNDANS